VVGGIGGLKQHHLTKGILLSLIGWGAGCQQIPTSSSIFTTSGMRSSPEMSLGGGFGVHR
jgi:hypothetical protein